MKVIPLNKRRFALVDDQDHDWLTTGQWSFCETSMAGVGYAISGRGYMHRLVAEKHGIAPAESQIICHRNSFQLDNRAENLFLSTRQERTRWRRVGNRTTSGVLGIKYMGKCWQAYIQEGQHTIYLGHFDTKEEAVAARLNAEKRLGYPTEEIQTRRLELLEELLQLVQQGVLVRVQDTGPLETQFECLLPRKGRK